MTPSNDKSGAFYTRVGSTCNSVVGYIHVDHIVVDYVANLQITVNVTPSIPEGREIQGIQLPSCFYHISYANAWD